MRDYSPKLSLKDFEPLPKKKNIRGMKQLKKKFKLDRNLEEPNFGTRSQDGLAKRAKSVESVETPDKSNKGLNFHNPSRDLHTIMTLNDDESRQKLLQ